MILYTKLILFQNDVDTQPRRRAAPLKLSNAREIDPAEIDMCKREDGSDYLLGAGSFGEVGRLNNQVQYPFRIAIASETAAEHSRKNINLSKTAQNMLA